MGYFNMRQITAGLGWRLQLSNYKTDKCVFAPNFKPKTGCICTPKCPGYSAQAAWQYCTEPHQQRLISTCETGAILNANQQSFYIFVNFGAYRDLHFKM